MLRDERQRKFTAQQQATSRRFEVEMERWRNTNVKRSEAFGLRADKYAGARKNLSEYMQMILEGKVPMTTETENTLDLMQKEVYAFYGKLPTEGDLFHETLSGMGPLGIPELYGLEDLMQQPTSEHDALTGYWMALQAKGKHVIDSGYEKQIGDKLQASLPLMIARQRKEVIEPLTAILAGQYGFLGDIDPETGIPVMMTTKRGEQVLVMPEEGEAEISPGAEGFSVNSSIRKAYLAKMGKGELPSGNPWGLINEQFLNGSPIEHILQQLYSGKDIKMISSPADQFAMGMWAEELVPIIDNLRKTVIGQGVPDRKLTPIQVEAWSRHFTALSKQVGELAAVNRLGSNDYADYTNGAYMVKFTNIIMHDLAADSGVENLRELDLATSAIVSGLASDVPTEELGGYLEARGVKKGVVERIKDLYEEKAQVHKAVFHGYLTYAEKVAPELTWGQKALGLGAPVRESLLQEKRPPPGFEDPWMSLATPAEEGVNQGGFSPIPWAAFTPPSGEAEYTPGG